MNNELTTYVVWPDGDICELDELWEYTWKSNDYEIVRSYLTREEMEDKYNV